MKQIAFALILMSLGSSAMAACPELNAGFHQDRSEQNYDATCTVFGPKVSDRGIYKSVAGDIDKVCEAFGFGPKSGVDGREQIVLAYDQVIQFDGPIYKAKTGVLYSSITCRMPKLK